MMARAFISNFSQQRSHSSSTKSSVIVLISPCHSFRWSVGEVIDHGIGHRAHQEQESPIVFSLFRPLSSPASTQNKASSSRRFRPSSSPTSTQNKASSSRRFRPSSSPTSIRSNAVDWSNIINKHSEEQSCRLAHPHEDEARFNSNVITLNGHVHLRSTWRFASGYNETLCD